MIFNTSTKTFNTSTRFYVKNLIINEPTGANQTISFKINQNPTTTLSIPARGTIYFDFFNEEITQLYLSFSGTQGNITIVYSTSTPTSSTPLNVDLKNLEIFGFLILGLMIFFITFYIGQFIYNFLRRF